MDATRPRGGQPGGSLPPASAVAPEDRAAVLAAIGSIYAALDSGDAEAARRRFDLLVEHLRRLGLGILPPAAPEPYRRGVSGVHPSARRVLAAFAQGERRGQPLSYREVGVAAALSSSTGEVSYYVGTLARHGYLTRAQGRTRAVRLTALGWAMLEAGG